MLLLLLLLLLPLLLLLLLLLFLPLLFLLLLLLLLFLLHEYYVLEERNFKQQELGSSQLYSTCIYETVHWPTVISIKVDQNKITCHACEWQPHLTFRTRRCSRRCMPKNCSFRYMLRQHEDIVSVIDSKNSLPKMKIYHGNVTTY